MHTPTSVSKTNEMQLDKAQSAELNQLLDDLICSISDIAKAPAGSDADNILLPEAGSKQAAVCQPNEAEGNLRDLLMSVKSLLLSFGKCQGQPAENSSAFIQHLQHKDAEIDQLKRQLSETNSHVAQQQQQIQQQQAEISQLKPQAEKLRAIKPTIKLWAKERPEHEACIAQLRDKAAWADKMIGKLHREKNTLQMQMKVMEQLLALYKSGGYSISLADCARNQAFAAGQYPPASSKLAQTAALKPTAARPASNRPAPGNTVAAMPATAAISVKPKLERADSVLMPGTPSQGSSQGLSESHGGSSYSYSSNGWFSWLSGPPDAHSTNQSGTNGNSSRFTCVSQPMAGATADPAASNMPFTTSVQPPVASPDSIVPPAAQSAAGNTVAAKPSVATISVRPKLQHVDSVAIPGTPNRGTSRAASDSGSSATSDTSSSSWYDWISGAGTASSSPTYQRVNTVDHSNNQNSSAYSSGASAADGLSSWFVSAANMLTTVVS